MTREEAIEVINEPTKHIQLLKGEIVYSQFFVEAMEMAITALEREEYQATHPLSIRIEPQENCDTCEHSDEIDGSNCSECVKGIRNNYIIES